MILDTALHIIDTSKIVINNITPEKSFTEIYAPHIASGITALITLIVLIFTLRSNRKRIREDNLIKIRKEWVQDFSKLSADIFKTMNKKYREIREGLLLTEDFSNKEEIFYSNLLDELEYYKMLLSLKIRLSGVRLTVLNKLMEEFISDFTKLNLTNSDSQNFNQKNILNDKLKQLPITFKDEAIKIIEEENKLLPK